MKTQSNSFFIMISIMLAFTSGYLYQKVNAYEKKNDIFGTQEKNIVQNPTQITPKEKQKPNQETKNYELVPKITEQDHILGNLNADLVLVEYADFECPFCKSFHPTMQKITKKYGDKVAWVYRHYPLPFHANAEKEAEASECAAELGDTDAFWKYTDTIYEKTTSNGTGFALSDLPKLASEIGINENSFKTCLDSGKYAEKVKNDLEGGQKAGIQGTPGTIIVTKDGKKSLINGALPFDQVKTQLDELLK